MSKRLVIICGPQAVGKMTVGEALASRTGLKLFHNHATIELVTPYFGYGSPEGKRLVGLFREEIFQAVAASDQPGLIFTYVFGFDLPEEWAYIRHLQDIFSQFGGETCVVELQATLEERLRRNETPHRLDMKPTKRNVAWSRGELLSSTEKYRLASTPEERASAGIPWLLLENTDLTPEEAAAKIDEWLSAQ